MADRKDRIGPTQPRERGAKARDDEALREVRKDIGGVVGSANSDNQGAFAGSGGTADVVDEAAADRLDQPGIGASQGRKADEKERG